MIIASGARSSGKEFIEKQCEQRIKNGKKIEQNKRARERKAI